MNAVNTFLEQHNREQSAFFLSSDEEARRALYLANHPTHLKVQKCMDGRVNVPAMTDNEVPMGVISPFRNMGGKFKIGSPNFAHYCRNFFEHVLEDMKQGKCPGGLEITTYHFSQSGVENPDLHLGCKGFGYDTKAACEYTAHLTRDFAAVYGVKHQVIHPVHMGIETDLDSFVFHGDVPDTELRIRDVLELSKDELTARLRALYPEMKPEIFHDLLPLAVGNQRHVRSVVASKRPIEKLDHAEQIIGVGRGFDWLHLINKALIVGPFSVAWRDEVAVAANIVLSNFKEGRIPKEDGAVLLVSAPYREYGVDASIARMKAIEMARLSVETIKEHVPELFGYDLEVVVGTLDRNTMRLERIDEYAAVTA
jgi:hypothetical protein